MDRRAGARCGQGASKDWGWEHPLRGVLEGWGGALGGFRRENKACSALM